MADQKLFQHLSQLHHTQQGLSAAVQEAIQRMRDSDLKPLRQALVDLSAALDQHQAMIEQLLPAHTAEKSGSHYLGKLAQLRHNIAQHMAQLSLGDFSRIGAERQAFESQYDSAFSSGVTSLAATTQQQNTSQPGQTPGQVHSSAGRSQVALGSRIDQVLYCSLAKQPFTSEAIKELVSQAKVLNRLDNITGMLMYGDGVFLQLIEGPPAAVRQLWSRLLKDKRHYAVVQLYHHREVEARVCDDWGMRLVSRAEIIALIREAKQEIQAGRETAWAPAIERLEFFLSSGWPEPANDSQLPQANTA